MSVNLTNSLIPGQAVYLSRQVRVELPIASLVVATKSDSNICYLSVKCVFQAVTTLGTNLAYQWYINGVVQINMTQNMSSFMFNTTGTYTVAIVVSNTLSNSTNSTTVIVLAGLVGLYFKSGDANMSASVVNENAGFWFYLEAGASYTCLIDYGDGQNESFNDTIFNFNNTIINHLYSAERFYLVRINCTNPSSSIGLEFNHTVEYVLTGLKLDSSGTSVNIPYRITFSLTSGSPPLNFTYLFNNALDSGFTYSNLVGSSSLHSGEATPTIHQIYFSLCNYVSCAHVNGTFDVSTPITGPSFTIVPTGNVLTGYTYLHPTQLKFQIGMKTGSNIKININTDSSNPYSTLPNSLISIQTIGDWQTNINDLTNK